MSLISHKTPAVGVNCPAASDLVVVVAVLVAVKQTLLPFSQLYAGPASTFAAMAVATFMLHRRGSTWRDLEFARPQSLISTCGLPLTTMGLSNTLG